MKRLQVLLQNHDDRCAKKFAAVSGAECREDEAGDGDDDRGDGGKGDHGSGSGSDNGNGNGNGSASGSGDDDGSGAQQRTSDCSACPAEARGGCSTHDAALSASRVMLEPVTNHVERLCAVVLRSCPLAALQEVVSWVHNVSVPEVTMSLEVVARCAADAYVDNVQHTARAFVTTAQRWLDCTAGAPAPFVLPSAVSAMTSIPEFCAHAFCAHAAACSLVVAPPLLSRVHRATVLHRDAASGFLARHAPLEDTLHTVIARISPFAAQQLHTEHVMNATVALIVKMSGVGVLFAHGGDGGAAQAVRVDMTRFLLMQPRGSESDGEHSGERGSGVTCELHDDPGVAMSVQKLQRNSSNSSNSSDGDAATLTMPSPRACNDTGLIVTSRSAIVKAVLAALLWPRAWHAHADMWRLIVVALQRGEDVGSLSQHPVELFCAAFIGHGVISYDADARLLMHMAHVADSVTVDEVLSRLQAPLTTEQPFVFVLRAASVTAAHVLLVERAWSLGMVVVVRTAAFPAAIASVETLRLHCVLVADTDTMLCTGVPLDAQCAYVSDLLKGYAAAPRRLMSPCVLADSGALAAQALVACRLNAAVHATNPALLVAEMLQTRFHGLWLTPFQSVDVSAVYGAFVEYQRLRGMTAFVAEELTTDAILGGANALCAARQEFALVGRVSLDAAARRVNGIAQQGSSRA